MAAGPGSAAISSLGLHPTLAQQSARNARAAKPELANVKALFSAYYSLDLKPEEVMMCAAHVTDLQAARANGLRTGFIYRPNEFGDDALGCRPMLSREIVTWCL